MKKLFLLIIVLTLKLFSQGWNDIKTTDINEPEKHDILANSSGIHILTRTGSGVITYYKLNSEGDVQTTYELEPYNGGDFPNIVGSNDKIYAVYKAGNNIRVKYSTDNGSSWSTNIADRPTTDKYCNGVDAVYEPNYGVHIVWATQDGGASGFETYYRRLASNNTWADAEYKNVTDYNTPEYGGNPSVTVSPNRVHVSFNTDPTTSIVGPGDVKTRDKYYSSWQTPQPVVTTSEQSVDERLIVRGDYLYLFYNCSTSYDLKYKTRPLTSSSWSNYPPIESGTFGYNEDAFEITKTYDDSIHVIYKKHVDGAGWVFAYTYYNGTNWSTPDIFDDNSNVRPIGLSSISNDFFVTWVKTGTPYLRFRQWDAAPLAPQNFQITNSGSPSYHPVLSWNQLNEPDVRIKSNGLRVERSLEVLGQWSAWTEIAAISGESLNYTDDDIYNFTGAGNGRAKYRIRSYDDGGHFSSYSNEITIRFGTSAEKIVVLGSSSVEQYSLGHNFPNPFNPSTKISFSIKEEGLVTLKVYDVLGKEVETLVNESKPEGNYEVQFDASQLPSGMYVYSIQAGSYKESKKMLLMK